MMGDNSLPTITGRVYAAEVGQGNVSLSVCMDVEGDDRRVRIGQLYALVPLDGRAMPDSLRDYFAGQALVGLTPLWFDREWSNEEAAKYAYQLADALLAARDKAEEGVYK